MPSPIHPSEAMKDPGHPSDLNQGRTGNLAKPKIKVLIVDDSAVVRRILAEAIASEPDMEVVGTAPDAYIAHDMVRALRPDVLTLDIEMPRMNGLTFLKRLMQQNPVPTIIISSLGHASCAAALEALRCGAVEVIAKPAGPYSVGELRYSLAPKIRAAATAHVNKTVTSASTQVSTADRPASSSLDYHPATVIAIGASTGGTVAIQDIFLKLPSNVPGIVVSQHIPAGFSLHFANRLNQMCDIVVREAVSGDRVQPGLALIAPGNFHLVLRRIGEGYIVELQESPATFYLRPSVDVMFNSVAQAAGPHAIGLLLTGMGCDGAAGMLAMKNRGAKTIAQDEASCVVYGMPREAVRLNAASRVAPLSDIPELLLRTIQQQSQTMTAH